MKDFLKKVLIYILRLESILVLKKYKPKIVAVTGSVGKTSTKDAVFAVLSNFTHVRKSEKSFNSEIGLPLTVLGCPNGWNDPKIWLKNILKGLFLILLPNEYPEWLVLEVGVGKPGDMKRTASWLGSDAVILTAIGETPSHIEFFESRDHLVKEKSGLIKTLKKDGILILNRDDETIFRMKEKTKNKVISYGFNPEGDLHASSDTVAYSKSNEPEGVVFRVDLEGNSLPVSIEGVFGRNHIYAALAALAFAYGEKFDLLESSNALRNYKTPPGRMRLLKGISDSLIIDDCYNSSPFACEAGLKTLGEIKGKFRKIVVLGDMLELGKHTREAHSVVGKIAKENAEILFVVGQRAKDIKEGALEAGLKQKNIFEFLNSTEAGEFLKTFVKKGDLLFIKGSQGMRMERAIEAILLDQKNKSELLVRQDPEWLNKK